MHLRNLVAICFLINSSGYLFADTTGSEPQFKSEKDSGSLKLDDGVYAEMKTTKGTILLQLEYEKVPMTVANFVGLAEGTIENVIKKPGEPFYDGLVFHRVISDFMIQGGDPTATGRGGPGYMFADEFDESLRHNGPGILSMANAGPGTNGSQFFITYGPQPHLDGKHSVFGHVVSGMDVVTAISQGDPISKVSILRIGEKAQQFVPATAPVFAQLQEISLKAKTDRKTEMAGLEEKMLREKKNAEKLVNEKYPSAIKTNSGLHYIIKKDGKGKSPVQGSSVTIQYTGKLLDGTVFHSTVTRKKPFVFHVGAGEVPAGLDEAVQTMKRGEQRTLIVPPDLGYGTKGAAGVIPPNAWLVFEIELVDF